MYLTWTQIGMFVIVLVLRVEVSSSGKLLEYEDGQENFTKTCSEWPSIIYEMPVYCVNSIQVNRCLHFSKEIRGKRTARQTHSETGTEQVTTLEISTTENTESTGERNTTSSTSVRDTMNHLIHLIRSSFRSLRLSIGVIIILLVVLIIVIIGICCFVVRRPVADIHQNIEHFQHGLYNNVIYGPVPNNDDGDILSV